MRTTHQTSRPSFNAVRGLAPAPLARKPKQREAGRLALEALLTPREQEIVAWVAAGKTDAQIAAILGRSARTVQKHLEHVYVKLGVENRTAAAMCAQRGGLLRG
jgi:DNA-binding CsgD family transcriptional regulator